MARRDRREDASRKREPEDRARGGGESPQPEGRNEGHSGHQPRPGEAERRKVDACVGACVGKGVGGYADQGGHGRLAIAL